MSWCSLVLGNAWHALTLVSDTPLPVLGCFSPADELELVGGEPLAPVLDGGPLAALAQFVDVEQRLVLAALHLDARLAAVKERLEVGDGGEPLEHQVIRVLVMEVLPVQWCVAQSQVGARMGEEVVVGRRMRGHYGDGGGI